LTENPIRDGLNLITLEVINFPPKQLLRPLKIIWMANKLRPACDFIENFLGDASISVPNLQMVFHNLTTNNITKPELEVKSIVTPHIVPNFIRSASLFIKKIIDLVPKVFFFFRTVL